MLLSTGHLVSIRYLGTDRDAVPQAMFNKYLALSIPSLTVIIETDFFNPTTIRTTEDRQARPQM